MIYDKSVKFCFLIAQTIAGRETEKERTEALLRVDEAYRPLVEKAVTAIRSKTKVS